MTHGLRVEWLFASHGPCDSGDRSVPLVALVSPSWTRRSLPVPGDRRPHSFKSPRTGRSCYWRWPGDGYVGPIVLYAINRIILLHDARDMGDT